MKPIDDTYAKHINDAKYKAKDYSLIPEFRISEHMDYYIDEQGGNFLADNPNLFSITGSTISSSNDADFAAIYSNSDFLKDFGKLRRDHKDVAQPTKLELKASAVMRFVPYQGFYPVERTLKLAELFSASYGPNMILTGTQPSPRPINQALFAPGILFNSIKSGIAVSTPVFTSSVLTEFAGKGDFYLSTQNDGQAASIVHPLLSIANFRTDGSKLPFEAIIEPHRYITTYLFDYNKHPSASLDAQATLGAFSPRYSLAAHNFAASSVDFFIQNGSMTSIVSAPDSDQGHYRMQLKKRYKARLYMRSCAKFDEFDIFSDAAKDNPVALTYGINGSDPDDILAMATLKMSLTSSDYFTNPSFSMYDRPYFDTTLLPEESRNHNRGTGSYKHGGSAFGTPLEASDGTLVIDGVVGSADLYELGSYADISYDYYTPPYYQGFSFVDLDFKPFDENGNESDVDERYRTFTVPEIFSRITASQYRYSTTPVMDYISAYNNQESLTGSNCFMQNLQSTQNLQVNILDSINIFQTVKDKKVIYDDTGRAISIEDDTTQGTRWSIQTKWELPIFDYSNASVSSPSSGSQNVGRGIWHHYGTDLGASAGLFLQFVDAPRRYYKVGDNLHKTTISASLASETGSLAEVVGFPKTPFKVGQISDKQTVSEAIVAIPFIDTNGRRRFFKLDDDLIELAKTGDSFDIAGRGIVSAGQSVVKTINAMQKYVIPPKFDFITYNGKNGKPKVDPIAMYFFEFDFEFDREDVKKIWHNVAPKEIVREDTVTIRHELFDNELLDGFHDKLKWMVFKVKQKATWNYYEKTIDAKDDQRFKFKFNISDQLASPDYSYNWPYDFMSVVEFGKIEASVVVETDEEAEKRRSRSTPKKKIKPNIGKTLKDFGLLNDLKNAKPKETIPFSIQSNIDNVVARSISRITNPNRRDEIVESTANRLGTPTRQQVTTEPDIGNPSNPTTVFGNRNLPGISENDS